MTTFTGSRWSHGPRPTPVRAPHFCRDGDCCAHRIAAAEDARDWPERDGEMDDRAERESGWRE